MVSLRTRSFHLGFLPPPTDKSTPNMPPVPYSYPAPGASSIADAIRQRRGERGLTPLDGMLLNAQPIAEGWNKLLGAVRTGSSLQDDLREIMILRVAARNRAAFEWIHHEPVARKAGVTTEQLTRIGDIQSTAFSSPGSGQLSPLQAAAAAYADAMTAHVKVQDGVFDTLKHELAKAAGGEEKTNQLMVEATGTVAVYNMVSRFLVALDIDDRANQEVPVPGLPSDNGAGVPTFPESNYGAGRGLVQVSGGQTIATRVHFHSMTAPWVILINSLMTNLTMWDDVVPGLSDAGYNVVCYDQRGHGASPAPSEPCTVEQLADDAADVLTALGVDKARAVIGVSQGGATALSFAVRHPDRAEKIIANDTQPASPAANAQAWEDRIALAKKEGMKPLADATVARWYGSDSSAGSEAIKAKAARLIEGTDVFGFEQGARALQKYDLLSAGLLKALAAKPTLLVAGEADGALPKVLEGLSQDVKKEGGSAEVAFASVSRAAHLPMMDNPQGWLEVVLPFLKR